MLQEVIRSGDYSLFTQTALVLFFVSFVVLLVVTLTRSRRQTDQYARMPLADDHDHEPITTPPTSSEQGGGESI